MPAATCTTLYQPTWYTVPAYLVHSTSLYAVPPGTTQYKPTPPFGMHRRKLPHLHPTFSGSRHNLILAPPLSLLQGQARHLTLQHVAPGYGPAPVQPCPLGLTGELPATLLALAPTPCCPTSKRVVT
jgi:hypothetical protein